MDIYDVDYNQQTPELLPPDKRDAPRITLIAALLSSVQWCRDLILGSYKKGSMDDDYAPGTYPKFVKVIYQKAVYYSLVDNNTADPGNTDNWLKIQGNFLGVAERVKFNGQNIILEYALNQRFGGVFRPRPASTVSDIYMVLLPREISGFIIGQTIGSSVGRTTSSDAIGYDTPLVRLINFEVRVLSTIFATTNTAEIAEFINAYIPASIKFRITTY